MDNIYVHIGLPKTGTTTLQEFLFDRHPEVAYFGQSNVWSSEDSNVLLKALLKGDNSEISNIDEVLSEIFVRSLRTRRCIAISDEALTFGEFMLRGPRWNIRSDHRSIAQRIREVLGAVEIILVVRNQVKWIESWYKQGLKTGKFSARSVDDFLNEEIGSHKVRFLDLLNYELLYQTYVSVFGESRVHVFVYEQYEHCFDRLACEMAVLMDIDKAKAQMLVEKRASNVTGGQYERTPDFLRRAAGLGPIRLLQRSMPVELTRRLRKSIQIEVPYPTMTEEEKHEIFDYFAQTNRRFFQLLSVDGAELGYY